MVHREARLYLIPTVFMDCHVEICSKCHCLEPEVVDIPAFRGISINNSDGMGIVHECGRTSFFVDLNPANRRHRYYRIRLAIEGRVIQASPIPRELNGVLFCADARYGLVAKL